MVTGWDKGFIIEHEQREQKCFSCRMCDKYFEDDKSCAKGCYLPEVGYDNWKHCAHFKYTYYDIWQDKYVQQIYLRGRISHVVSGVNSKDIYRMYNYTDNSRREGSTYTTIKDERAKTMRLAFLGEKNALAIVELWVPTDFYDSYKTFVMTGNIEEYINVIKAFYVSLGITPGSRDMRRISKRFHVYYMERLFSGQTKATKNVVLSEFTQFMLSYMDKKGVFKRLIGQNS